MKRVMEIQHADGQVEIVCPKCDVKFEWITKGQNVLDQVEVYACPCCGMEQPPVVEEREYWPTFYSTDPFVYRCPRCFGVGKCVQTEEQIDITIRTYSCQECDSFWKVIG